MRRQPTIAGACRRKWHNGLFIVFLLFLVQAVHAQTVTTKYIRKYKAMADSLSEEYGIPIAVILGVAIVESGSGASRNCKLLNNHFGITGKNNLLKTKGIRTRYKQYKDAEASFADFCKLQKKKKYYKKLKDTHKYMAWLDAISKSGYSELPAVWKNKVASVIKKHKLSSTP